MTKPSLIIGVDFDGTVVDHRYPKVGEDVPGAVDWLRMLTTHGCRIVLFTMRAGLPLADAVKWYSDRGIPLFGINRNPEQDSWTSSPKAYAHIYVDDSAVGCPLREGPRADSRSVVDWSVVGPLLLKQIS